MIKEQVPEIEFLDNCLLIDREILVFSDFHIGYEEYIYGKTPMQRFQLKETLESLENIFRLLKERKIKIKQIIILGDLKHEFGEISETEWRETLKLLDYLNSKLSSKNKRENIVLIKGNHDSILGPIATKKNIKLKEFHIEKGICFVHGDKLHEECLKKDNKILMMGHLHPSIILSDEYKREKFKCFLKGKWKKKDVYVLPSFSPMNLGFDLDDIGKGKKDFLMVEDKYLKKFEVVIYNNQENKLYNFGKLKKLI